MGSLSSMFSREFKQTSAKHGVYTLGLVEEVAKRDILRPFYF